MSRQRDIEFGNFRFQTMPLCHSLSTSTNSFWRSSAVSCIPFLLGLLFYGERYTLSPVLDPIAWGEKGAVVGIATLGPEPNRGSLLVAPGRVEVLPDDSGWQMLSSRVCFTDTDILVAYTQAQPACNAANVYDTRQLLDATVNAQARDRVRERSEQLSATWKDGLPMVTASINGTVRTFVREFISRPTPDLANFFVQNAADVISMVLRTLPATTILDFTDAHRTILHDSARLANVTLLRIVMEPTATAIAHGLESASDEQRVLVLDVGVSVSATLLEIDNGVFETLARVHDCETGGRSLDERIAGYAQAAHIRTSGSEALSTQDSVVIDVLTNDGAVFSARLARNEFIGISMDLFADVMQCVEQMLLEANVTPSDVTQTILAGGSAYIPKLSELLSIRFPGRTPLESPNIRPEEAVVYGAALHAFALGEEDGFLCCVDINPLAFGIEIPGGVFAVVIPRNSVMPNSKTTSFNLTGSEMRVFVGHEEHTNGTHFLGSLVFPRPLGGETQIHVIIIHPSEESGAATTRMLAELEASANSDAAKARIQYASHVKFTVYLAELERYIATIPADHGDRPSADLLMDIIREADIWMAQHLYTLDVEALREKMMCMSFRSYLPFWNLKRISTVTEKVIRLGLLSFKLGSPKRNSKRGTKEKGE
ncbi:Hsp70 protein-domain-containing protein [Mycena epipterygia]|nr:Hsp70 protein-domain-containing protein [Mycena epipterygia]